MRRIRAAARRVLGMLAADEAPAAWRMALAARRAEREAWQ